MDTNDLYRRLRYALQLDDADAVRLMGLAGRAETQEVAAAWRARDGEPDHIECPAQAVSALLDGLVLDRRGPPDNDRAVPPAPGNTSTIDNNTVLKGVKIALSMRTEDVRDCIVAGGGAVTNSEVGSLLRRADARNFRGCGDQMLRRFLSGLAERQRPTPTSGAHS